MLYSSFDHLQLSLTLNNMHHVAQVFEMWDNIIPPLRDEEKSDTPLVQEHTRLSEEIQAVFKDFDDRVKVRISDIAKAIINKVCVCC